MNITSLSPNNVSFRTQTPPPARATNGAQQSGRFPQHHGNKITSVVTADASQSSTTAAGTLLDTLV